MAIGDKHVFTFEPSTDLREARHKTQQWHHVVRCKRKKGERRAQKRYVVHPDSRLTPSAEHKRFECVEFNHSWSRDGRHQTIWVILIREVDEHPATTTQTVMPREHRRRQNATGFQGAA